MFRGEFETGTEPDEWNWRFGKDPEDVTRQICNAWKSDYLIKNLYAMKILKVLFYLDELEWSKINSR